MVIHSEALKGVKFLKIARQQCNLLYRYKIKTYVRTFAARLSCLE